MINHISNNTVAAEKHKSFYIILISLLLAVLSIYIYPNNFLIIISIVTFTALYYLGKRAILLFVLISYLTSLSEYIGNLRLFFNMIATFALIYLFLKEYKLNFREYPKPPQGIIIFVFLIFINLIISTLGSNHLNDGISAIITMGVFFIICYMLYGLINDIKTINLFLYTIILSFIIISIRMFLDLITLGFEVFFLRSILEIKDELSGSSGYTHITIFFISFTLISSFLLRKDILLRKKGVWILLMILNTLSLIFANARAGILAAILSVFFLFVLTNQKTVFKFVLSFCMLFLCLYLFIPEVESSVNLYLRIDSINDRIVFWQSSAELIAQNPIIGVGPRAFYHYFFSYAPSYIFDFLEMDLWSNRPTPHNLFLMYWVENGIGGLLLVIFLFMLFFRYCYKVLLITRKKYYQLFVLTASITGLGVGFLVRSFFEISGILHYGFITTDLPFWIIFIIILRIYQVSSSENILRDRIFQISEIKFV